MGCMVVPGLYGFARENRGHFRVLRVNPLAMKGQQDWFM